MKIQKTDEIELFKQGIKDKNLYDVALKLVDKYKDVNLIDSKSRSLLMWASIYGDSTLAKYLLDKNIDVDMKDLGGLSALHFACQEGHKEIIENILKSNADINIQDKFGRTPLSLAVYNSRGNGDIIILLLNSGANPHIKNNYNVTAYELAKTIANYDIVKFFNGYI
jgi:ankyrin repeat protein